MEHARVPAPFLGSADRVWTPPPARSTARRKPIVTPSASEEEDDEEDEEEDEDEDDSDARVRRRLEPDLRAQSKCGFFRVFFFLPFQLFFFSFLFLLKLSFTRRPPLRPG